ncbi:MAG TPA: FIST domain containing protein [Rhodospirillaceae bacterium]|nr:MAG: FIST domain containing protein [Alphaproteobacteria bacterium GWF2_58_20]HAU29578.1 FIST domain containing protein [Rhodospirillaceae bacterium]
MSVPNIRTAQSCLTDTRKAAQAFHAAVAQPDMSLVVFFCSSTYDLDALAEEMNSLFAGVQVVGCTTAGEIGPAAYTNHSISGASFPAATCKAVTGLLEGLGQFDMAKGREFTQALMQNFESRVPGATSDNSFAFLLIDGMSRREEPVTHALQHELGNIQLVGGSAGDDGKFDKTHVYHDGRFHVDAAILTLINTELPFKIFKTQHFVPTDERMVVTEASPADRVVREIDGLPASLEYARKLQVETKDLNPMRFAASPVVVMIDGTDYVRAIQKANADGSLTFFCAIEDGVVLRVAHGVDLLRNLEQAFEKVRAEIGPLQLVLGCDCILRKLEIEQRNIKDRVWEILRRNNVVGFNTYGEQFCGVHVNQTFTGLAIGMPMGADTKGAR